MTALLILGAALRVLALVALWPTTLLEDGYQTFVHISPFLDPQHPAGYGLILGALGAVSHQVLLPVLLQHLSGIISALLLGAAVRRLTGSVWAGLLPAAIVLLDPDEVFLEHSIMSESWGVLATSVGLYAAVRSLERPRSAWPLLTGAVLAVAVTIRTAGLPLIAVSVVALLAALRGARPRRLAWQAPLAVAVSAAAVLLAFAGANARYGYGLRIEPSPGWYLYGRVAQFADCRQFTPPQGTKALCERRPASQRPSAYYYTFIAQSPAARHIGAFGSHDGLVGAWARRALVAQFGDFLGDAWQYLRSYYVPSSRPARLKSSTGLDPQLDFTYTQNVFVGAAELEALKAFFSPFKIHRHGWALHVVRVWQRVVRFGATALFLTTILTLVGLVGTSGQSRFGVALFGLGGLSLLLPAILTGTYSGRYTVPLAGPLVAASAITVTELVRRRRARFVRPRSKFAWPPCWRHRIRSHVAT